MWRPSSIASEACAPRCSPWTRASRAALVAERQTLLVQVRDLLTSAAKSYAGTPHESTLTAVVERMDEPLRVAIAGKVKAGKSTLLNALVGEELAPTDAGECTKLVTWYIGGHAVRGVAVHKGGRREQRPFSREGGALDVDLGAPVDAFDHLEVSWPS